MKLNDIIIGLLLISAMTLAVTPLLYNNAAVYPNATIDADTHGIFSTFNDTSKYDTFSSEGVGVVEGKGTVTDATSSGLTLEGGFSYIKAFFSLPSTILAMITAVTIKLGLPTWISVIAKIMIGVVVVGAVLAVAFRTDRVG